MKTKLRLFCLLLCLSIFSNTFAYIVIDKIYYVLNPDSVSAYVDDSDYYISGDVNIPDVIWYNEKPYTVTRIGHDAFSVRNSLISVNIPNSVKTIEYRAFQMSR